MAKVVALVSGGIDSPIAAYLIGRATEVELVPVYFDNYPFSGETTRNRALACCRKLSKILNITDLYIFPHGENLLEFVKNCKRKLTCVLCRRMMFRVAEEFAQEVDGSALVTGESLGQVASQTLANIFVEDRAVRIPVLRPLIGLNKEEIVRVARKIGTFEASTLPASCCSINPREPATKAKVEVVLDEEKNLDMYTLVSKSLSGRKKIPLETG